MWHTDKMTCIFW